MPRENKTEYHIGDKVMLILAGVPSATKDMWQYDQKVFSVSKVIKLKEERTTHYWTYYELDGCTSKKGIPYSISGDWLYSVRD